MNVKAILPKASTYAVLSVFIVIFLFPIYWMAVSSFRDNSELMSLPPKFSPIGGSFQNYIKLFHMSEFMTYFKNSVLVASSTVLLTILVAILAGYALSRFDFRYKSLLMTALISIQIFPTTVIIISLFTFYRDLGMLNTYRGLILADTVNALPFSIWLIKSFYDTVPRSLDEAAYIDGCGRFRTLWTIITPLILPGLLAIGVYAFLGSWDDFIFSMTIMKEEAMKTLPIGLAQSFMGEYVYDYSGMMTMSMVASLPVVILFIFLQKYMVAGLTAGAVKG